MDESIRRELECSNECQHEATDKVSFLALSYWQSADFANESIVPPQNVFLCHTLKA